METVCVLLSTYNGEKYIAEQLDSILRQSGIRVDIFIRDDGSTDSTVDILRQYANKYSQIKIFPGNNIGYERSYLSLLTNAGTYQYYAFSDQDDVWDDNKLDSAIKKIRSKEEAQSNGKDVLPVVYWCNLRLVDCNLKYIADMKPPTEKDFKIGRYLLDNYGYGCTMVFNQSLKNLSIRYRPRRKISHDNWLGLIGILLGDYIFDNKTYIAYRQHDNNVVGGYTSFWTVWKRRYRAVRFRRQYSRSFICQELLEGYNDLLDPEKKRLISLIANCNASMSAKLALLREPQLRRSSSEKDMWFRLMVIFSLA